MHFRYVIELSQKDINLIKKNYPLLVGNCIKYFRKKRNITQTKLAELTDKDRQYIYKIENGKVTSNIATIKIIITALDISSTEFYTQLDKNNN